MPIKTPEAKRLCTPSEFELYTASLPKQIKQLTPAVLKRKIDRARKLRDKWNDQAKRQRLEVRGKQPPRGARAATANIGSERKAELFTETLQRFSERLRELEAAGPAAKAPVKKKVARKTADKDQAAKARRKKAAEAAVRKTAPAKGVRKKVELAKSDTALEATTASPEPRPPIDVPAKPAAPARKSAKSIGRTAGRKLPGSETAAKQARINRSGAHRVQSHISSRGRRSQARRDARR